MNEKWLGRLQIGVFTLISALVIAGLVRQASGPHPQTTLYHFAKETIQKKIAPKKIWRMTSPRDLRVEKMNGDKTNISGWFVATNSGVLSTQWFECVVSPSQSGRHNTPVLNDFQIFRNDPATNGLHDSKSTPP